MRLLKTVFVYIYSQDDDYSDDDESLGEVFADLGPDWFDRNAVDM